MPLLSVYWKKKNLEIQYAFLLCFQESIGTVARQYKTNKKASLRERYKVAQTLHERLKRIIEDVSLSSRMTKFWHFLQHTWQCIKYLKIFYSRVF